VIRLDTTKLHANRPPKHLNNFKVTDLDVLGTGLAVRLIAVQASDGDGATVHAMYHGSPPIKVNDFVRCRRDTSDTNILIVEGYGGGTGTTAGEGGAWPPPGKCIIGVTEYADFTTAGAAASAGDEIRVGAGIDASITAEVDLTDIHAVGSMHTSTILSSTVTGDVMLYLENCHFSNLSVSHSVNSASREDSVVTGADAVLTNVKMTGANAGAGLVRSLSIIDEGNFLIDCHIETDGEAVVNDTNVGLITTIQGGYYKSTSDYAIENISGILRLYGPVLEGSSGFVEVTGGIVEGWFYDEDGNMYVINSNTIGAKLITGLSELTTPDRADMLWLEDVTAAGTFNKVAVANVGENFYDWVGW
jgi:hypothetical protein